MLIKNIFNYISILLENITIWSKLNEANSEGLYNDGILSLPNFMTVFRGPFYGNTVST